MAIEAGWPEEDIHVTENLKDAIEWSVGRAEAGNDLSRRRAGHRFRLHWQREISLLLKGGESQSAKLTRAQREWRPGMKKKERSTKMMLDLPCWSAKRCSRCS